ncbi:DEAD/DEAH box helicase family protein [Bacteroides salyersiae]|uniref:DEAD/DEAH box helicase family protein n=1 Tax=Bacteroides salyersiae TaxID=291644 RepID=UPI001897BF1B|nr:DEAD/DEAH box helicase family protein [Bacteroides salyersiae]
MNLRTLNISRANGSVQYLTEILPEFPTNTILYKKLTGLGATYGELKAKRNSVIIEPNKPVIVGKCKDPKHKKDNLFGVFDGVYAENIVAYLEKSIKQNKYFKILTTPESFRKVQDAFEIMEIDIRYECFLLFDECHKIVKDVDYRANITLPMDFFFECRNKALVSATPIQFTDPRFEEQKFQTITINPTFEYAKELNLRITNNVLPTMRETLNNLKAENKKMFIFCNSTDTIYAMMKQLNLLDESAVFCSQKSVNKLEDLKFKNASEQWENKKMKKYNWLTSRFYNALDIELEETPIVIMLTECYLAEYSMIDPYTDAIQIVGRFRNGVSSIYHIANTNHNLPIRSKDEIKGFLECSEQIYNDMRTFYKTAANKDAKDAYRAALDCLPFNKMLDSNKKKSYFAIDNYMDEELLKSCYHDDRTLSEAYSHCNSFIVHTKTFSYKWGDSERLKVSNKSQSLKEKRKMIVEHLERLGECSTEMEMEFKRELFQADSFIVDAYDTIGKAKIESLHYSHKKIQEAVILFRYHEKSTGTEVIKLVKNSFKAGKWYSASCIKKEIKRIYKLLRITPPEAVTSHTINEFFIATEKNTKNERGYLLISCRF